METCECGHPFAQHWAHSGKCAKCLCPTNRPQLSARNKQYAAQAQAIAALAESIATGTLVGPRHAAVARLADMVDTLRAWTSDDR